MFNKPFDEITNHDIERLITDGIREGRQIDYKQKLPGGSDGERKEFAADATSFANAAGGYIVFGITEQKDANRKNTGLPASVDGLANINADQEVLRLESMLRGNVAPIIPGTRLKPISNFPSGPVILLHIPRSWSAPHMVAFGADSRFHTRGSAGKQSMDVHEIRSAFLLSAEMPALIRRFRDERLGRIVADDTPVPLSSADRLIVHVAPFSAMGMGSGIDLEAWAKEPLPPLLPSGGWNRRFNFDGLLTYSGPMVGPQASYAQVFRSGTLEAVSEIGWSKADGRLIVAPWQVELRVIRHLDDCMARYRKLGFDPPIVVAVTLLAVKGAVLPGSHLRPSWDLTHAVERDVLLLPDVLVRDYDEPIPKLLRPAFDALWQAFGQPKSLCYDNEGNWDSNVKW